MGKNECEYPTPSEMCPFQLSSGVKTRGQVNCSSSIVCETNITYGIPRYCLVR